MTGLAHQSQQTVIGLGRPGRTPSWIFQTWTTSLRTASCLNQTVEFNGHRLPIAELQDLMWIAADDGIPLEEAIFRYGWQNQFAHAATELEENHPYEFAGAGIVNNGCGAWIAFSGAVPAEAFDLTASIPSTPATGPEATRAEKVTATPFMPVGCRPRGAAPEGPAPWRAGRPW